MRENKLVVLGAGGVGKTSLVVQYLEGCFMSSYKPTVEDYYRHTVQMPDGIFHTVEILDTAGSHHFPAMRELSIRSGRGFVLVFSVDSLQSFHEAVQLWELIFKLRGPKAPVVLVGNKSDLKERREVTEEIAHKIASDLMKHCRYIETSAKFNVNVGQLFIELLEQAKQLEQPPPDPSLRSRRLSRRLSSLGSLHGLTTRRKSSLPTVPSVTAKSEFSRQQDPKCMIL